MATHPLWTDDYWLLLLQLYIKRPTGIKPLYSRQLVELSLDIHIPPRYLYEQMFRLRQKDSPVIQLLWNTFGNNPRKLSAEIRKLRNMEGFGRPKDFYKGVDVRESFEKDFQLIDCYPQLKPVSLILILDLYFQLTPNTMVKETPEVRQMAKLLDVSPQTVVEVMDVFQFCDPYLNRDDLMISPLLLPCQNVWNRYGNDNLEKLSAIAAQLRDYFK